jgi:hypothetical protein
MSWADEAKAKEDTFASWAKPRLEERASEQRWRPTNKALVAGEGCISAARRPAIAGGGRRMRQIHASFNEAAMSPLGA